MTKEELSLALTENKAVFHKTCITMYNQLKLARKRKLCETQEYENDSPCKESTTESSSKMSTRAEYEIKKFALSCFFCDGINNQSQMHQCQTLELHHRVKNIATRRH